jgi:mycoredoxin
MIWKRGGGVQSGMTTSLKIYGAGWCEDTHRTRQQLDRLGVAYDYIDIDQDKAAETWITQQNGGKRKTPTVDVAGMLLFEPTDSQMEDALRAKLLL